MTSITHVAQDTRGQSDQHPQASKKIGSPAGSGVTTVTSAPFSFNGHIGSILMSSPDITDANYSVIVRNKDLVAYYTNASVAENVFVLDILDKDTESFSMYGSEWTVIWAWSTAESPIANGFQVMLETVT